MRNKAFFYLCKKYLHNFCVSNIVDWTCTKRFFVEISNGVLF